MFNSKFKTMEMTNFKLSKETNTLFNLYKQLQVLHCGLYDFYYCPVEEGGQWKDVMLEGWDDVEKSLKMVENGLMERLQNQIDEAFCWDIEGADTI